MAFVPVPDTAKVEMRYAYVSQQVENQLYFKCNTGIGIEKMQDLGEYLITNWATNVQAGSPDSLALREVYITDLTTDTSPAVTVTTGLPLVGATATQSSPNNVSLTCSFRTSGRGRSSRGRNYLLGIREDEVADNTVATSFRNRWSEFFNDITDPFPLSDDWTWSVVSLQENKAPRVEGLVQQVLTHVFVDNTVDSQRRRLPGRGR